MRSLYKFPGGGGIEAQNICSPLEFSKACISKSADLPILAPSLFVSSLSVSSPVDREQGSPGPGLYASQWLTFPLELSGLEASGTPCLVSTPARVLWCKLQLNEIVFLLGRPIEGLAPGTESFCIKLLRSLKTWTAHCSCGVLESMGSEPKSSWGTH